MLDVMGGKARRRPPSCESESCDVIELDVVVVEEALPPKADDSGGHENVVR